MDYVQHEFFLVGGLKIENQENTKLVNSHMLKQKFQNSKHLSLLTFIWLHLENNFKLPHKKMIVLILKKDFLTLFNIEIGTTKKYLL